VRTVKIAGTAVSAETPRPEFRLRWTNVREGVRMSSWKRAASGCAALIFSSLSLIAGGLAGCGSGGSIAASPPPASTAIPGNWEFTATNSSGWAVPFGAYLTQTGSTVSGTAWIQMAFPMDCTPECCGGPFYDFNDSLTGTLDSSETLTMGSAVPNGGPVFSMTGTLSGGTLSNGTFSLTGGCPDSGTLTGYELPELDGTYVGTMTSVDTGQSYAFSASLQQSSAVNSRGFLDVSGTATVSGYPCLTSATGGGSEQNSGFLGNQFGVTMNASSGGATLSLSGTLSQDGKTIVASYNASGGGCTLDFGTGTLTWQ
jgi:hypothetical protein